MDMDKENCAVMSNVVEEKLADAAKSAEITKADEDVLNNDFDNKGTSLQNAFSKFRERKLRDLKLQKASRKSKAQRTPEFKDALRIKFVEQCKKYLGVPYAERYKAPEDPIAPLYLDCCGLVRQVMLDLREDFGFVIGKWNQCYQMDTLPIEVPYDELKPGDLIFYIGDFTSKRSKTQKHDCVHVEVWLGGETGRATIGSRYFRGKVSIFPEYEFTSTSWTVRKIFFRSLDTWLSGECRSHCPEHEWNIPEFNCGKKSIFDISADEDVDAGGEEDDCDIPLCGSCEEEKFVEECSNNKDKSSSINAEKVGSSSGTDSKSTMNSSNDQKKPTRSAINGKEKNKGEAVGNGVGEKKNSSTVPPHTYYVCKSNGWRLVKSCLDKKDWQQLPFEYKFSSRFSLKWVERRSDIDYKSHIPGQLVNHIPNNDCITTKNGLLSSLRIHELGKSNTKQVETKKFFSPVKKPLNSPLRTRSLGDNANDKPLGKSPAKDSIKMSPQVENQKSSKPSRRPRGQSDMTVDPSGISINSNLLELTAADAAEGAATMQHVRVPWLPDTYLLESPADCAALIAVEQARINAASNMDSSEAIENTTGIWIYKPSSNNRGRGIKVIQGMDALKELCYGRQTHDPNTTIAPSRGIVQRYIENPLLLPGREFNVPISDIVIPVDVEEQEVHTSVTESEVPVIASELDTTINTSTQSPIAATPSASGHKFDIRCYMLIARNDPSYLVYYHPGYFRLCLSPYDPDPAKLNDASIHLTNASVQKLNPAYQMMKEFQIQTPQEVVASLRQNGKDVNADYIENGQLDRDIKLCMVDVLKAGMPTLARGRGYFDLLGCDFMITRDNELKLLEINSNPSLSLDNTAMTAIIPPIVSGALDIVIAAQGPDLKVASAKDPTASDAKSAVLNNLPASFELIYNENTKFEYV